MASNLKIKVAPDGKSFTIPSRGDLRLSYEKSIEAAQHPPVNELRKAAAKSAESRSASAHSKKR